MGQRRAKFQSTRPRGARPPCLYAQYADDSVSIHAPARGATNPSIPLTIQPFVSIHAPARGATNAASCAAQGGVFQSTRPRGARHCRLCYNLRVYRFQSTRPRGARHAFFAALSGFQSVSIHAPARGATSGRTVGHCQWLCFNPRARAGRDTADAFLAILALSFNPRARAGRDPDFDHVLRVNVDVSIHAPARGATRNPGRN